MHLHDPSAASEEVVTLRSIASFADKETAVESFAPFAFLLGIPWDECVRVGIMLGKKTVVNEFVAYLDLQTAIKNAAVSPRSTTIATYALCGFANFSSIAIQLGGIGGIAPRRRHDLARLGIKALIGGTLACFMTACIAGLLV